MGRLKTKLKENLRSAAIGAALSVWVGVELWLFPIGEGWIHLSYDLPFVFGPQVRPEELIIVQMDDASYRNLEQVYGQQWNRALHARLLEVLREARLVVFDVGFSDSGPKEADQLLAQALQVHGRVVLAAELAKLSYPGMLNASQLLRPRAEFLLAATNWGLSQVTTDTDLVVRQHDDGSESFPGLAWMSASLVAPEAVAFLQRREPRWLRYYGPVGTITSLSYFHALDKSPEFFRDKFVFIGGKPKTLPPSEPTDVFPTPYTRWDGQKTPGVELEATMFLNLLRHDWLRHCSPTRECLLLILAGLLFGGGLALFRPLLSSGLAVVSMLAVAVLALLVFWYGRVWFCWVVIAGAQVPAAWIWSMLARTWKLSQEKTALEKKIATSQLPQLPEQPTVLVPSQDGTPGLITIPDHGLIRSIGQGSYGEVWLARNAIGIYRAVKIVHRKRFKDDHPYEREFKGIQKFMPISLNHPGLVHLLHVGRNESAGYFYYIMELADDELTGRNVNPLAYSPRNLAGELERRKRMPIAECLSVSLALTETLQYLHTQQLIHRDIKPSNIIFINNVPKFADIGLVTDIGTQGREASYIGTEGYIAPEGPGSPAADIYSLGKVIYEVSMGKDRREFPELPDSLVEKADSVELFQLNDIILKACEPNRRKRYQSGAELHADLLRLQNRLRAQSAK